MATAIATNGVATATHDLPTSPSSFSAPAAVCPVTGMTGDCPASGASSSLSRTFHLGPTSAFTIEKTSLTNGRVLATRLLGQPAVDLFLSELPTKRAVERLTADWDLPQDEIVVNGEWIPELFVLAMLRFGYLGPVAAQLSPAEAEVGDFLDLSQDMFFYLKSVWRGVKGTVCVPATSILSRTAGSDVSIPEPSLRRKATTNGTAETETADASIPPSVVVSTKGQKTLILTGASRGIGHATVKLFVLNGWRVITISRHPFDEHCPWPGGAKNHFVWDLSDLSDAEEKIAGLKQLVGTGRVEALCCNAGISPVS